MIALGCAVPNVTNTLTHSPVVAVQVMVFTQSVQETKHVTTPETAALNVPKMVVTDLVDADDVE